MHWRLADHARGSASLVLLALCLCCNSGLTQAQQEAPCTSLFPNDVADIVLSAERCYRFTNGSAAGLDQNTTVSAGSAGSRLSMSLENVYALNVTAPRRAAFVNVSFVGTPVLPPPEAGSALPAALFIPAALDIRSGGTVSLQGCNIVASCAAVTAWAAALATRSSSMFLQWRYSAVNSTSLFFSSASSPQVSISSSYLTCDPASPDAPVHAAVNSVDQLASVLPQLNAYNTSTVIAVSQDMELDNWQAVPYQSDLTFQAAAAAAAVQPVWDMSSAQQLFLLGPDEPVLRLNSLALRNGCFQFNQSYPMPARLTPLSFTMGAVLSRTRSGPRPLSYPGVYITNSSFSVTSDEVQVLVYASAATSASPLFQRLAALAPFLQQLPVQSMSLSSMPGSSPSSLTLSSFVTDTLNFTNVTLNPTDAPSSFQPCVSGDPFVTTGLLPLNVYYASNSQELSNALTAITASGIATGSSFPPVVLVTSSSRLLATSSIRYTAQRDVLITGPLDAPPSRNGGSPSTITLNLASERNSLSVAASARIFIQRLVLVNPVIAQLASLADSSAVQRSALPLWAFSTLDGSARPAGNSMIQLYMCTLVLIPVDFLQLYNMAIRGSDWKMASATNVLVQLTDTFQVQSYDTCNILLAQYTGFGLNASNLLVQTENCDATRALINSSTNTPIVTPWPPPPASSSDGISSGAKIGIGVGVAAGALLIAAAGFVAWKLRRRPSMESGALPEVKEEGGATDIEKAREGSGYARDSQKDDPLSMWRTLYEGGLREDSHPPSNSLDQRATPLTSADRDREGDSGANAAGAAAASASAAVDGSVDARSRGARTDGLGSNATTGTGTGASSAAPPPPVTESWDPLKEVANLASNLSDEANKLVLLEPIGQGGFGTVYRGRWRNLEVAVKTVLFSEASKSGSDAKANKRQSAHPQQRAILEAAVCTSVMHPNLVTTYHYDITPVNSGAEARGISGLTIDQGRNTDWKLYLVQEYCNASLQDALRNRLLHKQDTKAPDMDLVLTVLMDIARGLVYIHGKNIIHGDLTPGNVLLKQDGNSPIGVVGKITDFGLCTTIDPNMTHISNVTNGTPYYVAPEVVAAGTLTKKSDVYSFGVLMWELYRCMPPWVKTDTGYTLNKRFRRFPLDTPRIYVSLCARCLDKNPKERPSFDEVLTMLESMHSAYLTGYDTLLQPREEGASPGDALPSDPGSGAFASAGGMAAPQSPQGAFQRESSSSGLTGAGAASRPGLGRSVAASGSAKPDTPVQRHEPPPRSTAFLNYFNSQTVQRPGAGSDPGQDGGGDGPSAHVGED